MPNFDESVINFAVYEDGVEYVGMAGVTLPNLSAIVQTLSGAGIAGNVEVPVLGHYDVMSLTLNFRTTTEQSVLNCCTSVANDIVAVCNGQEPQVKAQKPKF